MVISRLKKYLIAGLILLVASGCSTNHAPSVDTKSLYEDDIKQWLAQADPSEWDREILADLWVTDQEMRESIDRYTDCIGEIGIVIDGGYQYNGGTKLILPLTVDSLPEEVNQVNEHEDTCSLTYLPGAEIWYQTPRMNPQKLDPHQGYLDCFLRTGVVPEGTDLEAIDEPDWQPLPGTEDAASQCITNPFGIEDLPW